MLWDEFITKAKNSTFLFNRDFMDYHEDRFEDSSTLVFKNDTLFAVLPANKIDNRIISHQGLTYGGFVLKPDAHFSEVLPAFETLLRHYAKNGVATIELKMMPRIYNGLPSDETDYLLTTLEAELIRRDITSVIDNTNKIERRSSNRERGLKRAIKHNLSLKEVDDFEDFWNFILIPNLKKRHQTKPTHSLDEITLLKKRFPKSIRQFNAYHGDRIVAGVTIFETARVAHAQYISAGEDKQELGSLDFVFDKLINEVFQNKPIFDFGISNENQGQNINKGLINWKEEFGARSIVQDQYRIVTRNVDKLKSVFI